ncbi:MAG: FG-GAP repeat domain-containing protein, partial [Thermoplasmatota archaeon]
MFQLLAIGYSSSLAGNAAEAGALAAATGDDVTDAARLDFTHDAGDLSQYRMPQTVGSGAAVFDFDGDGRLDLYLLTNGGPQASATNRLYRNKGDGTFEDVTA